MYPLMALVVDWSVVMLVLADIKTFSGDSLISQPWSVLVLESLYLVLLVAPLWLIHFCPHSYLILASLLSS